MATMSRARLPWLSGLCVVTSLLLGCGQRLTPVTGRVTFEGQPLAGAEVKFLRAEGPPASGTTDADGRFTLSTGAQRGAARGSYAVSVVKLSYDLAGSSASPVDVAKLKMYQGGKIPAPPRSAIPWKYGEASGSGLKADVTGDPVRDVFAFHLQ
jgi:hypothetical protein